jgi:hypothetical protein
MTDSVEIALIISIAPTIAAVASAILGFLTRRKLMQVDKNIDGRLSKFIEGVRIAGIAQGVLQQKEEQDNAKVKEL